MLQMRAARFGLRHNLRTSRPPAIPPQFHSTAAHGNSEELERVNRRESHRGKRGTLMDHAPQAGWNEELATTSEASVKADREQKTMNEMKEKTVNDAQSQHNAREDAEIESTRASYAREEIDGPLGNASVGEFEGVVGNDDLGFDETDIDSNGRVVMRRVVHEKTTVRESGSGTGQANA